MHDLPIKGRAARPAHHVVVALLLFAGAFAAGCSGVPEREVLARVGDRVVTVEEFLSLAKENVASYPGAPDTAKRMLLDDIVRRELLLAEGRRLGFDRDSALVRSGREFAENVLARALYERIASMEVAVSDSEVAQLHRWRATKTHLKLLYTPTWGGAEQALAALKQGQPFAAVFTRFGKPGVLPEGGDVGWIVSGQLVDPLDAQVRQAPLNVPQGPFAAPSEGWFVALAVERQPNKTEPLEVERPALTSMLRQRKQRAGAMRAFEDLRAQYKVAVDPAGAQALFEIGNAIGQAPRPDSSQVIATYDGGTSARGRYTVGDAMRDAADPMRDRPPYSSTTALEAWIDGQVIQRVAVIEARRRRLDQEPAVARRMRAGLENGVLQKVFEERVAKGVDVTDAEVRQHYGARAAQFAQRDSAGTMVEPPAFDSLPEPLQQNLRQQALALKRDLRLREVSDEARRRMRRFEVHPERLKPLAWPTPPAMPGMPSITVRQP